MSTKAWGRTGHVYLRRPRRSAKILSTIDYEQVLVDEENIGAVWRSGMRGNAWTAVCWRTPERPEKRSHSTQSKDAAVSWVLRRAATAVWREERPVVLKVRYCKAHDTYEMFETQWVGGYRILGSHNKISDMIIRAHQYARSRFSGTIRR